MTYINFDSLEKRFDEISKDFRDPSKPYKYTMFEDFFSTEKIDEIYDNYPEVDYGVWNGTTYIDQKNKFQKREFEAGSIFNEVFQELNSEKFRGFLERLSGINDILPDEELFGGGLHQSINGAFLNVHVDYNIHPITKYHRRLNVLVYLNKEWKEEYEGALELWDFAGGKNKLIGKYFPILNRCVIFETNEVSFHGHPKPLKTPEGTNRKSIATYYYTKTRPENEIVSEHNTLYVNTEGVKGEIKRFLSGVKAFMERINKK